MSDVTRDAEALWRATVYLVVALLHLDDNLLLRRPLAEGDVKSKPAGHWGTVPGTAWILSHAGLAAGRETRSRELVPVIGAGHAGVVQLALAWLTGDLARLRPQFSRDLAGLTRLAHSFPEVDGLGSEVHPLLPGGSYQGGYLGGALAFAQGAALDAPDRVVVPILGDGECETPTTAAAWLAARELPNGAVLPVVHLNGFRMGARSLLSTMTDTRLDAYMAGFGWKTSMFRIGQGSPDEHAAFHDLFRQAIDATASGQRIMLVLRCVKGWTGPPDVGGRQLLGTPELHKTPLFAPRHDPGQRRQLQDWLASYRPAELLDTDGRPAGQLASAVRRVRLRNLHPPHVNVDGRRTRRAQRFDSFADAVTTVLRVHATDHGLKVFSPDELSSNRLTGIAGQPWVVEALAEEVLLGWLAGWTASGRPGLLISYEAFAPLLTTGIVAHLKQRRLTSTTEATWPSVNLLLTSYGWHNVYTHGDPSLATALLGTTDPAVRVFTPAEPTRVAVALDDALHSTGKVNLIVAGKHPTRPLPVETIGHEAARGLAVWPHASDPGEPDLTIVSAGDLPAAIAYEAAGAVRDRHRRRVRVVNIHDLTVLGDPHIWPAGLGDDERDHYLGAHAALLVLTLGHPAAVWGLLAGRPRRPIQVIGWREPPTPMTQPQLAAFCGLDVAGVVDAAARLLEHQEVPA